MMKKLSKIALLAAATAFLLAAFPACEHENKDEDEKSTNVEKPSDSGNPSSPDNPDEDKDDGESKNPDNTDADKGSSGSGGGTEGNENNGSSELVFPLSILPTTEGSSPAYPTEADLDKNAEFKFTSPVAYTVCTKKKFDTGKYIVDSETTTANRWNLGGALKDKSSKYNCYIKFDSAPSAKMTVKFYNTNTARTLTVVSGTVETVGTVKTTKSDGTNGDLMSETFPVTKGSEVYLGATENGIWVAEIIWEE